MKTDYRLTLRFLRDVFLLGDENCWQNECRKSFGFWKDVNRKFSGKTNLSFITTVLILVLQKNLEFRSNIILIFPVIHVRVSPRKMMSPMVNICLLRRAKVGIILYYLTRRTLTIKNALIILFGIRYKNLSNCILSYWKYNIEENSWGIVKPGKRTS